jgi:hypothetical protein
MHDRRPQAESHLLSKMRDLHLENDTSQAFDLRTTCAETRIVAYSDGVRRFRGTKKRLRRIRWTAPDRWFAALIVLICLLAIAAGGWLGFHYSD